MTATTLPEDLKSFRSAWMAKVGLGSAEVGALPDASHKAGGGYHCGVQDIRNIGKYPDSDYSTRQTRDRIGGNACCAVDTGLSWGNGGQAAAIRFNNMLVSQMIAKDPSLAALRGVNFTPDGKVKRRYDSNNPNQGIISSTDTVLWHTHFEWWRNTENTPQRQRSFERMLQLADAAIASKPAPIAPTVGSEQMQILVNGFGETVAEKAQIWLADGMFRRRVPADWYGNGSGPISNQQVHQAGILGNLSWGGKVFASAGDPNVWGLDVEKLGGVVELELSGSQVEELADAVAKELQPTLEDAAFEGAQRAEKE